MPQISGTTADLWGVSFTDADTRTAVGYDRGGLILRTLDGGATWIRQANPMPFFIFAVSFVDANLGFAVGAFGVILRTIDGGRNLEPSSNSRNLKS